MSSFRNLDHSGTVSNSVIVHAEPGWMDHILTGECDFFEKIGYIADKRNLGAFVVNSDELRSVTLLSTNNIHIMMGPKRHRGRNIYHAHPSYIPGFWYLDTKGYFWNSSISKKPFLPETVDIDHAEYFFNGVSGYMIRNNISKRPQSRPAPTGLDRAVATIFIQDIEKYKKKIHFITTDKIISNLALAAEGRVYVKLHPLLSSSVAERITKLCAQYCNVHISEASVHDLIAASDVVVSQNSAVGFEALMHKKPVITCGQCDYHHATLISRNERQLRKNIAAFRDFFTDFPFEKYFYWFLGLQMLEPQKDDFKKRAVSILFE